MNFKTVNFNDENPTGGTYLQGNVVTTYDRLVELFGKPTAGCDKTQANWCLRFDDGLIAVIYDWKEYELEPEQVTDWHIGGHKHDVVFRVIAIVEGRSI